MTAAEAKTTGHRELLGLLGNDRRCLTIEAIAEMDGDAIDTRDLTERVAAKQYGAEFTSTEQKRVYVSLYQTHVPTLREAGVLTGEGHAIQPGERFETVVDMLDAVRCQAGVEPIRERSLRARLFGGMV